MDLHEAPELEAMLPSKIQKRSMARWSVAGRCWFSIAGWPADRVESDLAKLDDPSDGPIDINALTYAVAGRADTKRDPPFFVFAANRSDHEDEITVALALMLGGAGYNDVQLGADLGLYEQRTIAGHEAYVGTPLMIRQDDHQRGSPYLYQTDTTMFIVITDDDAWAEDAIRQLP